MQNEEIQKVLNSDEKVLWQGKPDGFVYMVGSIFGMLVAVAIVIAIALIAGPDLMDTGFGPLIIVGIAVLVLGAPVYRVLLYKYIIYLITDKRIILQSGLIGRDFEFVDYDKIESSGVDVGIMDKVLMRNTGSISIYANRLKTVTYHSKNGGTSTGTQNVPFVLSHVADPYTVFSFLKKTSFDVKADINYPNALRPEQNPGYGTSYNLEQK